MTETRIRDLGTKSHLDALLATVGKVEGLRVVDIGCGEGQMARALAALGADVTGYDPFIEGTEPVAHGAGRFRLVRASADAIPEPNQSTDLVLFIFSLHHVPGAKLRLRVPQLEDPARHSETPSRSCDIEVCANCAHLANASNNTQLQGRVTTGTTATVQYQKTDDGKLLALSIAPQDQGQSPQ